ncbi:MAG TPA: hypothetical protein PKM63_10520 [Panacibacter sp.]|nr:hypothetical protein [Panacibacter sp.]HNP44711.1 hypothetical protein [Panacibacter sp.]
MENEILNQVLRSDDAYLPLLVLMVCFFLRKKIPATERLLIIYLFIQFAFSTVTNVLGYFKINNLFLYHFFTLFDQWFVTYYLARIITKGKMPVIYYLVNIVFTVFWIINISFFESYHVFNTNTAVISSLIILLLCMYYMLDLSKNDDILYFQKLPAFWIVNGFLLYNALSILIFAVYRYYTAEYSLESVEVPDVDYWVMMHFPISLKYIMIAIGIACYYKVPSIKQESRLMAS